MICLVDAIGALDAVSISSVTAEDSPVPAFTERLEEGAITYGGIYRAPNYELISAAGCPLAIENTYIDHVPEARAKLEELGVTVLMEQSSREEDMLGRLEWIRLMGALFGRDEEADEVFEDVAARVEEASSEGPLGTTVAFLYVNEDGAAVTRRAGDYFCQMIEALLLGGALSLSGFLLQTFFANPIADPFVLGVSSGAKLVVAVVMIVVLGAGQVMSPAASVAAAFAGSLATMGFVLVISRRVRTQGMLIVAGIMVGYICSAVTSFLVAFADDQSIVSLDNWSRGSFSGAACFRRLARDGVPFATGVLHEHDADGLLARSLASRAVCERDFEPVSERAVTEAREVLLGCRRVICCVSAFGTTNARNTELLDAAREAGIPVTSAPVPPHRVSRDCIQAM